MFLAASVIAFIVAKLEINIEGKHGWAESLPTGHFKNKFTKILWGKEWITAYHLWLALLIFTFLHFPFWFGHVWTLSIELQLIAGFLYGILLEDILWFVMNPYYGIRKLNKENAPWHNNWLGPIPGMYTRLSIGIALFLGLSLLVK